MKKPEVPTAFRLKIIKLKLENLANDRDRDHQLYRQMDERLGVISRNIEHMNDTMLRICADVGKTLNAEMNIALGVNKLQADVMEEFGTLVRHQTVPILERLQLIMQMLAAKS